MKLFSLAVACIWSAVAASTAMADESDKASRTHIELAARKLPILDIDGHSITPLAPAAGHFSILVFTATECPIANAFSPEIARIAAEFEEKCTVYLIYTDPDLSVQEVRDHLHDYSLKPVTAILDIEQTLVQATGATHTPEASVIDSEGNQIYRGRINNRYAALGKARHVVTKHDLRAALDSIIAGSPVSIPRTEVIGCYIPTPRSQNTRN
ncbi:MAG: redoxin domain-containing protein [Verrucomicrobia bacterium]|nr:redoxin domain-containing protein [Verrucomicrobiota bacterium]